MPHSKEVLQNYKFELVIVGVKERLCRSSCLYKKLSNALFERKT